MSSSSTSSDEGTPVKKFRLSHHAYQRVQQRLRPILGNGAKNAILKVVERNCREGMIFDVAPGWANYRQSVGGNDVGWIVSSIGKEPVAALINTKTRIVVTVLTASSCD